MIEQTVEIYIDNQLVDYTDLKALPLEFEVKVDRFFEIGASGGISIQNAINSLVLPASKRNIGILAGKTGLLNITILVNGQQRFTGSCLLISDLNEFGQLKQLQLDVIAGNSDFFSQLEGVSLRDLDLGVVMWDDASIQASWVLPNPDTHAGIFAPVIMGC